MDFPEFVKLRSLDLRGSLFSGMKTACSFGGWVKALSRNFHPRKYRCFWINSVEMKKFLYCLCLKKQEPPKAVKPMKTGKASTEA